MEEPTFKHDCDNCQYVGMYEEYDVYACGGVIPTMVLRFGYEGHEYESMSYAGHNSLLGMALEGSRAGLTVDADTWKAIAKWSEVRAICTKAACSSEVR